MKINPTYSLLLFLFSLDSSVLAQSDSLEIATDRAHTELWSRFVDSHGIIRDFVGELPTPEDCELGKPNAIGWWSPIENGPMFTGLYLPAMCERARRSGSPIDKEEARKLAQGLLKCASVSEVSGFVARGVGADGVCHYPLSSDDQMHPWFLGLHAYFQSEIPTDAEREVISAKISEVANVLESTGWQVPCDGAFTGQFRGSYRGHLFRDAVRYLFLLRATHEVTGDPVWLERYERARLEKPEQSEKTRMEICAEGYPFDREAIKNIDGNLLWIYVGCQASLAKLIDMDEDESNRKPFRVGLVTNATNALPAVQSHTSFDNEDVKIFGHADWRAAYPDWFPQPTQADAEKLARMGDRVQQGERKGYESRFMRNPLAGAAIVALVGDGTNREVVEQAIGHYDYSKLNMAELFFAECAYYALPEGE